jgi:hypothetical protein
MGCEAWEAGVGFGERFYRKGRNETQTKGANIDGREWVGEGLGISRF